MCVVWANGGMNRDGEMEPRAFRIARICVAKQFQVNTQQALGMLVWPQGQESRERGVKKGHSPASLRGCGEEGLGSSGRTGAVDTDSKEVVRGPRERKRRRGVRVGTKAEEEEH